MRKERIETANAPLPGGWYSQAFRIGDLVYTAGITANHPVTQELVGPGDVVLQTRQILNNMREILRAAGSDLDCVFKTLVFIADIDQFAAFNAEYRTFFPKDPPARSTMQVGKFPGGMVLEIEAIAVLKDGGAS